MNRTQKEAFVDELRAELESAQSVILTSYSQLEVNTMNDLRSKFRAANVEYHVVKNTLAKLAAKGTDKEPMTELLSGPIAIAYSKEDAVTPAKIVDEFAKANPDKFVIRGGVVEGDLLDDGGVKALANMPSKDELRAMLLRTFNAGPIQLLKTFTAGPIEFARLLEAKKLEDEKAA